MKGFWKKVAQALCSHHYMRTGFSWKWENGKTKAFRHYTCIMCGKQFKEEEKVGKTHEIENWTRK